MASETVTVSIEAPDGEDEVELPAELLQMLAEGDQNGAEVVGDLALFSCAQRVHTTLHHAQGEPPQQIQDVEPVVMELFEERFGQSFGEATGHQH